MTSLGAVQNARLCPQPCSGPGSRPGDSRFRGPAVKADGCRARSAPCRLAVTRTRPGALLSDWRAAKAVAARLPGTASCARTHSLLRGPGLRAHPPMSAVNTVILRYGRAVIPSQRRRRGRSRQACPRRPVMPGEPGGNRQPVRWGPKSRPAEATTRSGRRSCRRWSLAADISSVPSPPSRSSAATAPRSPGPRSAGRSILLPVAHSSRVRTVRQHPATACRNAAGAGILPG